MKNLLGKRPYTVFLLPLFFMLHGYWANAGFIAFPDLLWPFSLLLAGNIILFLFFCLLLKDARKAGLITLFCFGFYLFFGAVFDGVRAHSPWRFTYKYSVLLGSFIVIAIILFVLLFRTKKDLTRATFFTNLLFIIFILADGLGYIIGQFNKYEYRNTSAATLLPATTVKPDIYLLLFDEYTGSSTLKQCFDFDNSPLDSFLSNKGFHLIPGSRSNYESTAHSMASMLNMDYVKRRKKGNGSMREELIDCGIAIRNNKVISFLDNIGYEIINYSTFDLANHPARVKQEFIPVSTRLIMEETLLYRLSNEFKWYIKQYPVLVKILPVTTLEEKSHQSAKTVQLTCRESGSKSNKPKFVYSHFMIPHWPFLYDAKGNRQPEISMLNGSTIKDSAAPYLKYLEYGNLQIRKLVDSIQINTQNKAVIILMSDHGFRGINVPEYHYIKFQTLNAVYLPNKNYGQWNDSVTNVNQFRILFNTLFDQQNKMLNDSFFTIFGGNEGVHGF